MWKKILIIVLALLTGAGAVVWYFTRPPAEMVATTYSPGAYFLTNVKDSNKLFKTEITMVLSRDDQNEYLEESNYIIRDTIVFTLRDMTEKELRAEGAQSHLRQAIISKLSEDLGIDYITAIYFNEYIIQ